MLRHTIGFALLAVLVMVPASAAAFCMHNGELYAETTLEQEFAESRWVVHARVVAADYWWPPVTSDESAWATYRLEVLNSFKGPAPDEFLFFTERNSGGYYMDIPLPQGGGADIGGEYLLFLNPSDWHSGRVQTSDEIVFVNYACGQSRRWIEVSADDRGLLERLSG